MILQDGHVVLNWLCHVILSNITRTSKKEAGKNWES